MDLMKSVGVSASGMAAQSMRMQMIAENIANADSVTSPEGGPYRRKQIFFQTELDKATGLQKVKVSGVERDYQTPLKTEYNPASPYAGADGFVEMPNVNTSEENVNMRAASRAYEANMAAIESAKQMMARSLDLLR